jgi:uncharacterized hydrophobic protein (TIGR00271 family)
VAESTVTRVTEQDLDRMTDRLHITVGENRHDKWSAFWILLSLAAVIASAGVVADSTATVIGAMIVAPLMTPILGTALALVLSDRKRMIINFGLVIGGAALVILIGFLIALLHPGVLVADTNSQIAARVSPRLIDLLAALATGVVGAFALVRPDVSDTLPGVAIAISLVPPLAVVGITLEAGATDQALGALLLFGTNVTAIIATGVFVLLLYRVRHAALDFGWPLGRLRGSTLAGVILAVVLIAAPLVIGSVTVARQQAAITQAVPVARAWAESQGWQVVDVSFRQDALHVIALGPPPTIDEEALRDQLDAAGLADTNVSVSLLIGGTKELPAR